MARSLIDTSKLVKRTAKRIECPECPIRGSALLWTLLNPLPNVSDPFFFIEGGTRIIFHLPPVTLSDP